MTDPTSPSAPRRGEPNAECDFAAANWWSNSVIAMNEPTQPETTNLARCFKAQAAALDLAIEQVRWFLSVYSEKPDDFPLTREALARIALLRKET